MPQNHKNKEFETKDYSIADISFWNKQESFILTSFKFYYEFDKVSMCEY